MSLLSFKLETFEGPLDLLLHLISKHKLNIYDIEISLLLDQYMEYIDSIDEQDFDAAGDFLAMAARLVYIKTCSLLPQAQEAEEMKKELQGELIEYSVCKEAAGKLRNRCVYGDVFVRPPEKLPINKTFTGNIPVEKLYDAYMGMTAKARSLKPIRAEQFSPIVSARIVTVTSKIVYVLKKLYKTGVCMVSELYDGVTDKSAKVATFLAVLELAKSGRIYLNDENTEIHFNRETPRKHKRIDEKVTENAAEDIDFQSAEVEQDFDLQNLQAEPDDNISAEFSTEDLLETTYDEKAFEESGVSNEKKSEIQSDFEPEISVLPKPDASEETFAENEIKIEISPVLCEQSEPERYALESISRSHSLAVPAFAPCAVVEKPIQNTDSEFETVEKTEETYTEISECQTVCRMVRFKINRFSKRFRWGYPKHCGNCWSYEKERL